jgi:NAD-dependent SIR2 family protein deacetylase
VKINKLKTLMNMIKESKYMVVFTGAGISTSVGIKGFLFFKFKSKIFVGNRNLDNGEKETKKQRNQSFGG